MALNQRDSVFHVILNDSGADVFKDCRYIYHKLMCQEKVTVIYVGIIKHDRDLNENGDVETSHFHIALHVDKTMWFSTLINFFVELFGCNANQVTVSKTELIRRVRYLIHYDDIDKYQYNKFDIVTNDEDFTNKCFKYISKVTCIEDLISIVRAYPSLLELMSVLGYDNYKKYRTVIRDIRNGEL